MLNLDYTFLKLLIFIIIIISFCNLVFASLYIDRTLLTDFAKDVNFIEYLAKFCYNVIMNTFLQRLKKFVYKLPQLFCENLFVDRHNCLLCDKELGHHFASGLCEKCNNNLIDASGNICNKCGRIQNNEADFCITCQNSKRYFDFARSSYVYVESAQKLVYGLKFGNKRYYAKYMARLMADTYLNCNFDCDLVVAVPLSKKRQAVRGYNQSALLAKHIAKILKLELDKGSLVKIKDTAEQARKSGKERELNVLNAYNIEKKSNVRGRKILLIDDVLTTGATASEVSRILYKAKAKSVQALTFASTKYKLNVDGQETTNDDSVEE